MHRPILLLALALLPTASILAQRPNRPAPARPSAQTPAPNPSVGPHPIEARVIAIERHRFPDADLTLELRLKGKPTGRPIEVQARAFRGGEGILSFYDGRNIELAEAFYLLPNDLIKGTISHDGKVWKLESVGRVPNGKPAPAPKRPTPAKPTPAKPAPGKPAPAKPKPAPPKAAPPKAALLRVELSTDQQTYSLGEDVQIALTVTNRGTAPADFQFPTGQRYDMVVRRDGREVWRWSSGRAFTQAAATVKLQPGESLRFREVWPGVNQRNQPVPPGVYTISGWVTATGKALLTESSAEIRIEEQRTGPYIEDIIASPRSYLNQEIALEGVYRARLAERGEPLVQGGPPTSRSDWILQDGSGSIYVAGSGGLTLSDRDINQPLRMKGLVRMNPEGRLYIRAYEAMRLTTP